MTIKKVMSTAALLLGFGLAMSGVIAAPLPDPNCGTACADDQASCLASGISPRICLRLFRQCALSCGTTG